MVLKILQICQRSVETYIAVCNLESGRFPDHDYIEIATRFIDHWKAIEALEWLNKVDINNHALQDRVIPLKIQALELNGDYAEVEKERISWFEKTLSPKCVLANMHGVVYS